jgi:primosomal protein N'
MCFAAAVFPSADAFAIEHEGTGKHSCPACSRPTTKSDVCDDCATPPHEMN